MMSGSDSMRWRPGIARDWDGRDTGTRKNDKKRATKAERLGLGGGGERKTPNTRNPVSVARGEEEEEEEKKRGDGGKCLARRDCRGLISKAVAICVS